MLALAAALLPAAGCITPPPSFRVSLTGAQIPVDYVESWLRMSRDPRFRTDRPIAAIWSDSGFASLTKGECDIACTDRTISKRELEDFAGQPIEGWRVAFYGYALYVNPDNPLDSIFSRHVSLLFQKRITDWQQLFSEPDGAFTGPIRLIGPEKSTRGGDVLVRQARIWMDNPTWETMPSDTQIIAAVAADPYALGFADVGYSDDVRALGLRMQRQGAAAFPSIEEIESGRYGLAKVIYIYLRTPASESAAAVRDYLYSEAGKAEMMATRVWPIDEAHGRVTTPSP